MRGCQTPTVFRQIQLWHHSLRFQQLLVTLHWRLHENVNVNKAKCLANK